MTNFVKPDFTRRPGFKGGFGANPNFLPHDVRNELLEVLNGSALDAPQRETLVAYANQLAQMPNGQTETNADQREQINKVVSDAGNLLASLRVLTTETTGALRSYADEACVVPPSPLSVDMLALMREIRPAEFMSQTWDMVEGLKAVAEHASEQMALLASKNGKPLEVRQRGMVASLADHHYQMVGSYPPKGDGAWFARFVRILGGVMELHFEDANAKPIDGKPYIGGRIPGSGIKLACAPYFTNAEREEIAAGMTAAVTADAAHTKALRDLANCEHDWPRPREFKGPQTCWKCGAKRGGTSAVPVEH